MSTSNPFAQVEANRQARQVLREVTAYQNILPHSTQRSGSLGICRADGWDVSFQTLEGDFDLDEDLAKRVMASLPPNDAGAATRAGLNPSLSGGNSTSDALSERFSSELASATAGPGNIFGNINDLKQAGNARIEKRATDALREAARKVEAGAARSIKLNAYMTLYNANQTGKGRPRPKIRITGMPVQIVTPALNPAMRASLSGGGVRAAMKSADMLQAQKLGKLAASRHWSGQAAFLNGKIGGGVLTFAPSAAIDAYNSVERDMAGDLRFNPQKFLVASAKSQSGNLVGLAGGAIVGFMLAGSLAAAPVILLSLGTAILAQAVWGVTGMADLAGSLTEKTLKP